MLDLNSENRLWPTTTTFSLRLSSLPRPIKRRRATASFGATDLGWRLRTTAAGKALLSYNVSKGPELDL